MNRQSYANKKTFSEVRELFTMTSKVLELTENVDHLLDLITDKARQLLGCEISYITLIDETNQELVLKSSSGNLSEWFKMKVRLPLYEGIAGWVFFNRKVAVCIDYETDPRSSPRFVRVVKKEGIKSFIALPLMVKTAPVGVLFVGRRSKYQYSSDEVRIASAFANFASIGLQNSSFYTTHKKFLNRLRSLNERLKKSNTKIKLTNVMHRRLIFSELEGKGFDNLAKILSQLVNNPVIVEDRYGELIATGTNEGMGVNTHVQDVRELGISNIARFYPKNRRMLMLVEAKKVPRIISLRRKSRIRCLVTPIVAHSEILGYITIPQLGDYLLGEMDIIASEYAALIFALEIMKQRSVFEAEQRSKGDFINQLLYGNFQSNEETLRSASILGYSLSKPYKILAMRFADRNYGKDAELLFNKITRNDIDRMLSSINKAISAISPHSFAVFINDTFVVFADSPSGENGPLSDSIEGRISETLKSILKQIGYQLTVLIGIGSTCSQPNDYKQSFQQAMRAIDIGQWLGKKDEIIRFKELGLYGLLFDPGNQERLSEFCRGQLYPLFHYDNEHDTELVKTLSRYYDCNMNIKACSNLLIVHENTVRQRLERIAQILKNIDLNNGSEKLTIQLALKIWELEHEVNHRHLNEKSKKF